MLRRTVLRSLPIGLNLSRLWSVAEACATPASIVTTDPPHLCLLAYAKEFAQSIDEFVMALKKRDPLEAADHLDIFISQYGLVKPDPETLPLSKLISDEAYIRQVLGYVKDTQCYTELRVLVENDPQKLRDHILWILDHPHFRNMDHPEWQDNLLKFVKGKFKEHFDLFDNFNWEDFFRENAEPFESAYQFSRFFKDCIPSNIAKLWKRAQRALDLEERVSSDENLTAKILNASEKKGAMPLKSMSFNVNHALARENDEDRRNYEITVFDADPNVRLIRLGKIQDALKKHFREKQQIFTSITYNAQRQTHSLYVSIDYENDDLSDMFDQMCLQSRLQQNLPSATPLIELKC